MRGLAKQFWVLLFLTLTIHNFSFCHGLCRKKEYQALESLKRKVEDPSDRLWSWINTKDCCEWEGVVCNNRTNHVIELHIFGWDWFESSMDSLQWLQNLENLENLEMISVDLSKETNWVQVINMLPSITNLRLLNCSLNHIPSLPNLKFSSLETLDLASNNFNSSVPKWVFNLASLVSLELTGSNFTGPFPEGPFNLSSLTTFKVSSNPFNSMLSRWLFDLDNLEILELSNCGLEGPIPSKVGNITKLKHLDLSSNNLNSTIPNWLYECKNLESLILSSNNLEGTVSDKLSNLSSITDIDLSENKLSGKLPSVIGKLWKLEDLNLSENLFEDEASEVFDSMSNCLPGGLGNCSSLSVLRLNDNKLTGNLPESIGYLSMLQYLFIFNNKLEGIVTESHFTNLTNLRYFSASRNSLTLKVSRNWIPPFQALDIIIGGWHLGPRFPVWLRSQKWIMNVDISNAGIEGEVPTWFWDLSSQIRFLNLSHNRFVGEIPIISAPSYSSGQGGPWLMYLASNYFSGPLPQISTIVTELDLSNNSLSGGVSHFLCEAKNETYKLEILNFGGNHLSDEIPECWMNWPELTVVILRENNLIGGIPRSMEVLSHLKSLDLRRNGLTGPLPSSLGNCTELQKIDLAENRFVGQIPPWLGLRLSNLIVLSLRSNKFDGELARELCHLKQLQILDLADNNFIGAIPMCISNFTAMITGKNIIEEDELGYSYYIGVVRESAFVNTKGNMYQYDTILALFTSMDLSNNNLSGDVPVSLTSLVGLRSFNFSRNHLTANIPNGIGDMKVLESVDLSDNQLSGQIPQSFSSLSSLNHLNLSHNNLSGKIPVSTQLQSFSPWSFQGNKLCGLPLTEKCISGGEIPKIENEKQDQSDEGGEVDWFYISMAIGFVVSFWCVSASLIFYRSWRHSYFSFLDSTWKYMTSRLVVFSK